MDIFNHQIAALVELNDAVMFDYDEFRSMVNFAKKHMSKVDYKTLGEEFQFDILRDISLPQGTCVGPEGRLRGALRFIKYSMPLDMRQVLESAYNFNITKLEKKHV
ncbi:hypothetical protein VPHD479_0245 [Vibrio phage D479]